MNAAIYIDIAFATASLVLSIAAFAVVIKFMDNPFKSNKRVDSLESKLAETGWVEGLTGKTIKGVEVA